MRSFMHRQTPTGFDDKAELRESDLTAPKPTLLVGDWNVLEAEICLRNRLTSTQPGTGQLVVDHFRTFTGGRKLFPYRPQIFCYLFFIFAGKGVKHSVIYFFRNGHELMF